MELRLAGKIAHAFIDSKLTPLIVLAALLAGVFAVWQTPREEEPQIVVPVIDVFVQMPGASAREVEQRVTLPMEKLLSELDGVEYIYSISRPGLSMVIVRYYVGVKEEDAIVKTYNKLYSNFDRIPPGVSQPILKLRSIDDVPILALTLWGPGYDSFGLRRIAGELENSIKQVGDVSETKIIGGDRRQVLITLEPTRLAAFHVSPLEVAQVLQQENRRFLSGSIISENREFVLEAGNFFATADELAHVAVAVRNNRPVYLHDVATIRDTSEEPANYVLMGLGAGAASKGIALAGSQREFSAVTITVAKRKGTNATIVSHRVLEKIDSLRGQVIPHDVQLTVTRNYGETAKEKSDELLKHMLLAIISVTLLIAVALGWRESGVVLLAIPVTLALTLLVFFLYGYTLNRVTLFALIFSIGILVDDAIVVVENMVRHFRLPENRGRPLVAVAVEAVDEVGNPTILATFAVIAAILPMAFVRGLMGPYMRPIPVGASAAMLFSLLIAFIISPWAAYRLLRHAGEEASAHKEETESATTRLYRRLMTPLVTDAHRRRIFLAGVVVLLLLAAALVPLKLVRVKMLPFDNKSEFQIILDFPEGTTLEQAARVAREMGEAVRSEPEVSDYQVYAGTAAPYNFNGLVRHYFLRRGSTVADLQVNLVARDERKLQSHQIAKKVRPRVEEIAARYGAPEAGVRAKIAEVPPGPPVLQTLVAEVYGPDYARQVELAAQIKKVFKETPGVVDTDWYVEGPQTKYEVRLDQEKAAFHGVTAAEFAETLRIAAGGAEVGLIHRPQEREDVALLVRYARPSRARLDDLLATQVPTANGGTVPLREIARVRETTIDRSIYHKNLLPVVYVTADVSGREESPVYAILKLGREIDRLRLPEGYRLEQFTAHQPTFSDRLAMKWDGEWHITYEVFRDLGLAFAAVLVLIYFLVVGWFESFRTPWVIMAPIPLTLVGILPAHALMGAFFTATSMIGFIAGAGIIVRNSIILVDFIELRRKQGMSLEEAVVDAGAVRFRPMLLTAAAVVVGAAVILFDPIFQGLAISLMAGEVASTLLSRMAVPLLYFMSEEKKEAA